MSPTENERKDNQMKKLFEKHETLLCIALIVLYILTNSYCIQNFGITDYRSALINTCFSVALIALIIHLKKVSYYGLTKVTDFKNYLYFVPLMILITVNLWGGIRISNTTSEIIFHVITMINVGFIEEIIFRGFLFRMMAKDNVKSAIIVSSITFGIGHIVNLLNGAEFIPTLLQICYAISIGYLFVIIFYKSKSLIPCIITHALFNALSIFNAENESVKYIVPIFLVVAPLSYAIYINKKIKKA